MNLRKICFAAGLKADGSVVCLYAGLDADRALEAVRSADPSLVEAAAYKRPRYWKRRKGAVLETAPDSDLEAGESDDATGQDKPNGDDQTPGAEAGEDPADLVGGPAPQPETPLPQTVEPPADPDRAARAPRAPRSPRAPRAPR